MKLIFVKVPNYRTHIKFANVVIHTVGVLSEFLTFKKNITSAILECPPTFVVGDKASYIILADIFHLGSGKSCR